MVQKTRSLLVCKVKHCVLQEDRCDGAIADTDTQGEEPTFLQGVALAVSEEEDRRDCKDANGEPSIFNHQFPPVRRNLKS